MSRWARFLDSLNTPGGHILVLLVLFYSAVGMCILRVPKCEDIMIGAFGGAMVALRGFKSNAENGGVR